MTASPYLTSEEAAVYVRMVSVEAFCTWARRKKIPKRKSGSGCLWLPADLDRAVVQVPTKDTPKSEVPKAYFRKAKREGILPPTLPPAGQLASNQ